MNASISEVALIYFSPTGTTRKIVRSIVEGLGLETTHVDCTKKEIREDAGIQVEPELVIIGFPVYEEHVPRVFMDRIRSLRLCNKKIICVCVYGNIGCGASCREMALELEKTGSRIVAVGAFVGEHSFSGGALRLSEGRPDGRGADRSFHR